jgi:hypothetical protein
MEQDEDLYLKANNEFNSKSKKEAVWVKALTLCKGDKEAAKYEYINLRVNDLKKKRNIKDTSNTFNKSSNLNSVFPSVDTSDANASQNLREASKSQYIQAWLIAAITSNILSFLLTSYMQMNIETVEEFSSFCIYSPFITSIISFVVWIIVVNFDYYKTLNVTKLVFWISTLGGLGTIANLYKTQMLFKLSGNIVPNHFYLYSIISFVAFVVAFYIWGESQKRTTNIIFLDP